MRMDVRFDIRFDERGLVPVIAQEADTGEVLMLAYANQEALARTLETGQAHYYSRSRQAPWHKGATSGHFQQVQEVRYDCDSDALLYLVRQTDAACHTGQRSCFYRVLGAEGESPAPQFSHLALLQQTIDARRAQPQEGSYTQYLFTKGLDKILKKVGEETAEVIIGAKNNSKPELAYETADLLYHLTVLLSQQGLAWGEVMAELEKRRK